MRTRKSRSSCTTFHSESPMAAGCDLIHRLSHRPNRPTWPFSARCSRGFQKSVFLAFSHGRKMARGVWRSGGFIDSAPVPQTHGFGTLQITLNIGSDSTVYGSFHGFSEHLFSSPALMKNDPHYGKHARQNVYRPYVDSRIADDEKEHHHPRRRRARHPIPKSGVRRSLPATGHSQYPRTGFRRPWPTSQDRSAWRRLVGAS
jgi:hypothetical protein